MHFSTDDSTLYIHLDTPERILTLHGDIAVAKEDIAAITWHSTFMDWHGSRIRMPGTNIPFVVMAGSFWSNRGWDFIYANSIHGLIRPSLNRVMVIVTKKYRYRRIIVRATESEAKKITDWWKEKSTLHV